MQKFNTVLRANEYTPLNIDWINEYCKNHPNETVLVEVPNTKCLNAKDLARLNLSVKIRIAGAYDDDRRARYKGYIFGKETEEEAYYDSVIYNKWEAVKIMEQIEKIESNLYSNWTNKQKIIYLYDYLKRHITYDPKYKSRNSKEVRSLRGLISKQTVCAGYAVILKELLERHNITCHYVQGENHAWNIIEDEGKLYPVDLTWENGLFRSGNSSTFDYLGQEIEKFNQKHIPSDRESFKDYQKKLSVLDMNYIKKMRSILNREKDYESTTYHVHRKDGSSFNIAQVGRKEIDGVVYYRYYFQEVDEKGKKKDPRILYSESNLSMYIDRRRFGKAIDPDYENGIANILFSKENIEAADRESTCYIGRISSPDLKGYYKRLEDIPKPQEKKDLFRFPTKVYHRSDGTSFILQRAVDTELIVENTPIYQYDIFEIVKEGGKEVLKKNCIFTEKTFMMDKRQKIADTYLSRRRIDRKVKEAGGYMGYLDENGVKTYNPKLNQYFDMSKKIDESDFKVTIPTFEECKDLVLKYAIDSRTNRIIERETKNLVNDPILAKRAMFANIWCQAAGVKLDTSNGIWGFNYAFNEPAEVLYNNMVHRFTKDVQKTGTINTLKMLQEAEKSSYKYSGEIIVRLFRSPFQTQAINELFHMAIAPNKIETKDPETLYSWAYVGELLNKEGRNL